MDGAFRLRFECSQLENHKPSCITITIRCSFDWKESVLPIGENGVSYTQYDDPFETG